MALAMYAYIKSLLSQLALDERAQDGFEYLLVVGGVTVAVIIAIATPAGGALVDAVVNGTCDAINTIPNITCTSPIV